MSPVQYPDEFMYVPLREGGDRTWRWGGEMKRTRESERERGREGRRLSMCWRASQAEPIANKPSAEISKEVITTGPAQFLTVDA